jgi:hypothetical protein
MNRVRLAHGQRLYWLTLPVDRTYSGTKSVRDIEVRKTASWEKKTLRTFEVHYGRTPYFDSIFPLVESLVEFPTDNLAEYNIHAISVLAGHLGFDVSKFHRSSQLASRGTATERLVTLVEGLGGDAYLSGPCAAETYQDSSMFSEAQIELRVQKYTPVEYERVGGPLAGLSIVDALFNCGFDETARLVIGE